MENNLNIRIAKPEDATAITIVMRDGFNEKYLAVLIYGCTGITRYEKCLIKMWEGISDITYVVAEVKGKIVGCVAFTYVGNSVLLNCLSVASGYRNKGLAGKLIKEVLRIASVGNADRILLDVFEYNDIVYRWYNRLGFETEYRNCWWVIDVPVVDGCFPGMVHGYPQSEACQKAYGFSQFTVHTATGTYTVGRLGHRWFRVSSCDALTDKMLHVTLRKMDSTRRYLAILKEGALSADLADAAELYAKSTRMSIGMKKLSGALG